MDITPVIPGTSYQINRYGNFKFTLNTDIVVEGNLLIMSDQYWPWDRGTKITAQNLEPLLKHQEEIEILIIGSPHISEKKEIDAIKRDLSPHAYSIDFMDTGAACRTYNVLLSEGRHVAAALVAIE